ncbi:MAG: chromate resistance protein, partial [Anaerolineales bacterium]|nr:chromate resistance protein [Anaerolineales bacterium]
MNWIALSYSLPSAAKTPRVAIWRRLRRLGAISPAGGVYVLPAMDDCVEAFMWLAQEVRQAEGEALVMHVPKFEPLSDDQLIDLFNEARVADYEEVGSQLAALADQITAGDGVEPAEWQSALNKLQKQHAEIARVDFFQSPAGIDQAARISRLSSQLVPENKSDLQVAAVDPARYKSRTWVTRPRPFVDRLASAWLIRRYIDDGAVIRYAAAPEADEVGFDMEQAEFSHVGNLCTFEVLLQAFDLDDP